MDALDMLTEDCWIEVFRKVVSAVDLKACSETCVLFETILSRRKSSWMLGVIIPFVFNYLNLQEEEDAQWEREMEDEEEENLEPVRFWSPIFRTRLLSKTLCHAVDTYIEENFDEENYPDDRQPASYSFIQEEEGIPSRIDEFIQFFETHQGNPFIGRNVEVVYFHRDYPANPLERYNEDDRQQESLYMGKLIQILSKFGHNIWTLRLEEWEYYQHLRFCKALPLLLCHLPNLRNLNIYTLSTRGMDEPERLDESDRREGMEELIPYLVAHPIPAIPHLETLDCQGLSVRMGQPLVEKYSPHLKCLKMFDSRPFFQCVERFNNLKELELWVDAQNTLEGLRKLQSPLETLTVEVRWDTTNLGLYDIQEFLLNLRHLPLKDLGIACSCFIGESVPIAADLQIESMRKLQILSLRNRMDISFNFLLCFSRLEEVWLPRNSSMYITSPHPRGIPEKVLVKELVRDGDLYTSDIWERIPSLKKFSFGYWGGGRNGFATNSYNRVGYEDWRLKETEKVLSSN